MFNSDVFIMSSLLNIKDGIKCKFVYYYTMNFVF